MRWVIYLTLFFSIGCSHRNARLAPPKDVQLYPIWIAAELPSELSSSFPRPNATGVMIAKGYIVSSLADMHELVMSFDNNPSLRIYANDAWHDAEIVDFDRHTGIVLIKTDLSAKPIKKVSGESKELFIIGLSRNHKDRLAFKPLWSYVSKCSRSGVEYLCLEKILQLHGGAIIVNERGQFYGIVKGSSPSVAVDISRPNEIAKSMKQYFGSWGRNAKEKPSLE
jgi:hypothetical protein